MVFILEAECIFDGFRERSLVSEFNLACGGMWKITLLQTSYFIGILLGAPFFTLLSDNIGIN